MVVRVFGFGYHSFLNEHIKKNKCKRLMEIGVYDGENAKNMIEAAKKNFPPEEIEYYGFDYFESEAHYQKVYKKLKETGSKFKLFKGDSKVTLPQHINELPIMDLIFIDGGKSYETAKSDWENCKKLLGDHTVVFVHNYGFPGVKRAIDEIPRDKYVVEIIYPPNDYVTARIRKR
ncbi:class I SAM-dependent methyltransferase [Thermococcus argininiproducens]|uniref:Class I SAM-dependent methyltransferase n=1 Tax=Thermococcus argininiproducens TaxID=2866384 RepID=A0A9E7M9Y2_9EURY|nr:class I SAM-dependent methyltransferase [Thermococcus argininiproducens]USH00046.1 class I SAM-dependent methyltransferase [Thermococcus argininiproducens]